MSAVVSARKARFKFEVGDLTALRRGVILHCANAQGVMHRGVANAICLRHPQVFEDYRCKYETQGLWLEDVIVTHAGPELWILSGVAQQTYGRAPLRYVDYPALLSVLRYAAAFAQRRELPLYMPLIGCKRAGGKWPVVKQLIEEACQPFDIIPTIVVQTEKEIPHG